MKSSQLALSARVYTILQRNGKPLAVAQIANVLFLEKWRGCWWFQAGGGVSRQQINGALCLMRARGLVRRTDGGWKIARRIGNVSQFAARMEICGSIYSVSSNPEQHQKQ